MSLAADALQPQLVRELIGLSGRVPFTRLANVITDAPGAGYDLDFDIPNSEIRLDFREPFFLANAIAGDAARFASACFSSLNSIETSVAGADTFAWSLVRLYYAAFYGGHGLLRLLGRSCSQIEVRHLSKLKSLATAFGNSPPFQMKAGLYHCVLNPGQTGFAMKQTSGRVGGAHEAFWEIFDTFLSEVTDDVLQGYLSQSDAISVFVKLEALRRVYRLGAGASWLSAVRNEVQYQHARGVWSPPSVNRTARENLSRLAGQWTRDPMDIDIETPPCGELGAFVAACALTAALCRSVLIRVAERSSAGARSFANFPLRLCV